MYMNRSKNKTLILTLSLILVLSLVGCGDKKKEEVTTSEEPTTTIEATTSEEPTTQEATTSEEPTTQEVEDEIEVGLWEYNGVETYYYHSWDETYGEYAHISLPYWGIEMDMSKGLFGDPNEFVVGDGTNWDYWTTFCENVQASTTTGAPSLSLHSITNGRVFIRECSENFESVGVDNLRVALKEDDDKDIIVQSLSDILGLQIDATNCEYDEVVVEDDGTITRTIEIESTFGLVEGDKQYGYFKLMVTPDDHIFVIVLVDAKVVNANTMRDTLYFINTFTYNPDHATHQATGNWEE